MKLRSLRFIADENIHPHVCNWLRSQGADVVTIAALGKTGLSDLEILRLATADTRAIVTHDSDFGMIAVANGESFHAIVYLRPGHIEPGVTIQTLDALWKSDPDIMASSIIVAVRTDEGVTIRIRQTREPG